MRSLMTLLPGGGRTLPALGALLLLTGCGPRAVRLGAVLPLTGDLAAYGQSLERGILTAEDQVNREGGIEGRRLDVLIRDSASDPKRAAEAFRTLVLDEQVAAVVGGGSSDEALAMAPLAAQYRRILFSPSASSPILSSYAGDFVFRNWPSDALEGRATADLVAYTLHANSVLLFAERNAYADGLASAFEKRFSTQGRIVDRLDFSAAEAGSAPFLKSALERSRGAQVLYLVGYGPDLLPLIAGLKREKVDRPMLSVSALAEQHFMAKAGRLLDGVVFLRPAYNPDSSSPVVQVFTSAYESRYHHVPDIYAAHAYDAVMVLVSVMARNGLSAQDIRKGLLSMKDFLGASGSMSFDARGEVIQPYEACVAEDGRVVPLKSVLDKVLPLMQHRVDELRFGQ